MRSYPDYYKRNGRIIHPAWKDVAKIRCNKTLNIPNKRLTTLEKLGIKLAKNINENAIKFGGNKVYEQSIDIYTEIIYYGSISNKSFNEHNIYREDSISDLISTIVQHCNYYLSQITEDEYAIYEETW
jgi:hypothetical protein